MRNYRIAYSDAVALLCTIESLIQMGYTQEQIGQSLEMERYDEVWAAYHLLGLPRYAVSVYCCFYHSCMAVLHVCISHCSNDNVRLH